MNDRIRKALSERVRAFGVTKAAAAVGVTQGSMSRWLRGDYDYNLNRLAQLADAIGVRFYVTLGEGLELRVFDANDH